MSKRVSLLVSCLVSFATACGGGLPKTDVDLGSGRRFVPQVVDSITNVGVSPSVTLDPDGNPVIAYLGYPSVPKPGEIPETRPVTLPLVPAVMYATARDGAWTVGTVQQLDDGLTREVNGNAVAIDNAAVAGAVDESGALNVVWIEKNGLMFAKDVGGQFVPETVAKGSGISGPSIAVGRPGEIWISYYRAGSVMLLTLADGWQETPVAQVSGCGNNCPMVRTSVQLGETGPIVAFAARGGASVATLSGEMWNIDALPGDGGFGISLALDERGKPVVSYVTSAGNITVAEQGGAGWTSTDAASVKLEPSALMTTGVGVDGDGVTYLTWFDPSSKSVKLATDRNGGFQPVSTPGTAGGGSPSIAVAPDATSAWVAWYDTVNEDLQAAAYGDQDTVFAAAEPAAAAVTAPASMESSAPTPTEAPPADDGAKPVTLSITSPVGSVGTGFTEKALKAPAGTPIKLIFDNQDTGVPHNVEIWTADPLEDPSATSLFVGEQTTGPAKITYDVPALEAGTYFYRCVVHPTTMTGTLTVE